MEAHDKPQVILYWRPGCGFCVRLARTLDAMDIARGAGVQVIGFTPADAEAKK